MKKTDGSFSPEVKELILKRTAGRCDRCGLRAVNGQFHHRKPRRAGGTNDPDVGLPSNGLLLHPGCHDFIERKRKIAAELGFLLSYMRDPHLEPVYLWCGWHILTQDGRAVPSNADGDLPDD